MDGQTCITRGHLKAAINPTSLIYRSESVVNIMLTKFYLQQWGKDHSPLKGTSTTWGMCAMETSQEFSENKIPVFLIFDMVVQN